MNEIGEDHPIWQAIDSGGGQTCDIPGVLRALTDAGYVIVPREPTEAMKLAPPDVNFSPMDAEHAWHAMIEAALDDA